MSRKLFSALILTAISLNLQADVITSGNDHYYELHTFTDDWRLDWNEAKAFAETLTRTGYSNGYLATITTQQEDNYLWDVIGAQGAFLGAHDVSIQNSNGQWEHQNWQWVSGESFSYTNWHDGEPNHWQDGSDATPNPEDYLMYWWSASAVNGGRWNDTNVNNSEVYGNGIRNTARGFVVEYNPLQITTPVPLPQSAWLFASGFMLLLGRRKINA